MSTSITTSFVAQYESMFKHVYQRYGGRLGGTVRFQPNVVGATTTFQKIGSGIATTKARHGAITPMNQDHTAIPCTLVDFYAGDWNDKLDNAKTNIDEQMAIAQGAAWALGRKKDEQIITALDATTQTAVTIVVTSEAAVRNGLLLMCEALDANDVPNDGQRYAAITARLWAYAMTVEEFQRSDFVGADGMKLTQGAPVASFKEWNNVKWTVHTGLPGAEGNSGKSFIWHKQAVGYAAGAYQGNSASSDSPVSADITWHGDRASFWIMHSMSGGACLIDDTGVIEANFDDNEALPTS